MGSTEVIESLIGKQKYHSGEQSKSGFTSSVLLMGAVAGNISEDLVSDAMNNTQVRKLSDWSEKNIGKTIQQRRRKLFKSENKKAEIIFMDLEHVL